VFEMAAPIQNPAKSEVRSVILFLNAKGESPAEIHKQMTIPEAVVIQLVLVRMSSVLFETC
jgi:hypothetical protein